MKFRPLCIDYHLRAQEIIATERDIRARRAALRSLPNPSPPCQHSRHRRRRCHWNADADAEDGIRSDRCNAYSNDDENELFRTMPSNIDDGVSENDAPMRLDERADADLQSAKMSANDRDSSRQRQRICEIINTLGPAVHPSECAFRPVAPVTKGPVRGVKLPVVRSLPKSLEEITNLYSNYMDNKLGAVIDALESGRSRFDSSIDNVFALASSEDITQHGQRDTTFSNTMKIEYSRHMCIDGGSSDPYCEMEPSRKSQIWNQHVMDLPMPKLTCYLRHEPDDLITIHRLKSQRSADTSNFARDVMLSSFSRPQHVRTPTKVSRGEIIIKSRKKSVTGCSISTISTKPAFSIESYEISQVRKEEDYLSRLGTVPFTRFLDHDDDGTSDDPNALTLESRPRVTIRLDPDFDPLHPTSLQYKPTTLDLLIPLNKMCSMSLVTSLFHLPSSFEESHPSPIGHSRFLSHHNHHRFEFITNTLNDLKDSVAHDQSMSSLLSIHEGRASLNGTNILPRKIWLDSDIETIDVQLKSNATKRPACSTSEMSFFSRTMTLANTHHMFNEGEEGSRRGRFVVSSSRVMGVTVLESVTNCSKATCIFLPQSIIQNNTNEGLVTRRISQSTERKSLSSDVVLAIRSGNLPFLHNHCSNYPVSSWFGSESAGDSVTKNVTELDSTILNITRRTFCHNAKVRSRADGSRILLLTGCSSRRNTESIYSYRGFLTNQIVDPIVFKHRYNATLRMIKLFTLQCNHPMHSERAIDAPALTLEACFTRNIVGVLANSYTRHAKSKKASQDCGLARCAPYAYRLKTKKHGQCLVSSCKAIGEKKTIQIVGPKFHIDVSNIDKYSTRFSGESPDWVTDTDTGNVDDVIAVEALGKRSMKVRGELLHLVMKASELEDGKKSFLAEFAVANRGRVSSQHIPLEGLGNDAGIDGVAEPSYPHLAATVDPTVPTNKPVRKRTHEIPIDENKESKKRKKKRRKKEHKKGRKRKRKDNDVSKESLPCETASISQTEQVEKSCAAGPTTHIMRVVVPSIPLGMTPINPPKKLQLRRKSLDTSEHCILQSDRMKMANNHGNTHTTGTEHEENTANTSAAAKSSPDSVAHLNYSMRFDDQSECHTEAHRNANTSPTHLSQSASGAFQREAEEASKADDEYENYVYEPALLNTNMPNLRESWTLLTSERFLESHGVVVAELASGSWQKSLLESEENIVDDTLLRGVVVCDCPLLDIADVDIELSDNSAVIVQYLSNWSEKAEIVGSLNGQQGSRAFIRRLVLLAASGRYNAIHVLLCLDVEMSSTLSGDIITLQNAVNRQSGCPAEHVTFEFVAPRSLAAAIALRFMSLSTNPQESTLLAEFILDENVRERARFLVMLAPTMTVHMALRCLGFLSSGLDSAEAMHNLFRLAKRTPRDLFPHKLEGVLSRAASEQLWLALNVDAFQN